MEKKSLCGYSPKFYVKMNTFTEILCENEYMVYQPQSISPKTASRMSLYWKDQTGIVPVFVCMFPIKGVSRSGISSLAVPVPVPVRGHLLFCLVQQSDTIINTGPVGHYRCGPTTLV